MTKQYEIVTLPLDEIIVGERVRQVLPKTAELGESIREVGLLQPIIVTPDHKLVGGQRRLEACRFLGWKKVPCYVVPITDALHLLKAEQAENTQREPLTKSEAVAQAKAIKAMVAEAAKERQEASRAKPGQQIGQGASKLDTPAKGRTDDAVAAAVGMKRSTLRKAEAVVDAAEKDPERLGPVVKEMDKSGKVDPAFKKVAQPERIAQPPQAEPTAKQPPTPKPERKGRGLDLAFEAIAVLQRIPRNDPLREAGLREVAKWIKHNLVLRAGLERVKRLKQVIPGGRTHAEGVAVERLLDVTLESCKTIRQLHTDSPLSDATRQELQSVVEQIQAMFKEYGQGG